MHQPLVKQLEQAGILKKGVIEPREYQERIAENAVKANTLAILPTGLGKTIIALLAAAVTLNRNPKAKILFMAPTKPLVKQHHELFTKALTLPKNSLIVLTGEIRPGKRAELWKTQIIFATPHTVLNDTERKLTNPNNFSLIVFDEAHRISGNYPYVKIAKRVTNPATRILALTASPRDVANIDEIIRLLKIDHVEARLKQDKELKKYAKILKIEWKWIQLGEDYLKTRKLIEKFIDEKLKEVSQYIEAGLEPPPTMTKILSAKKLITHLLKETQDENEEIKLLYAMSKLNSAIRLMKALEILDSQGYPTLFTYIQKQLDKLEGKGLTTKESKQLYQQLLQILETINPKKEHPKTQALLEILEELKNQEKDWKCLIFTNYRNTAKYLTQKLSQKGYKAAKLIGHAKQREQIEKIRLLRQGIINILVATQVGEEGLDIPKCNLVIFYDNVPSAVRKIQRLGRTARSHHGKAVILVAKNTIDEVYYWKAVTKLAKIKKTLEKLSKMKSIREESLLKYMTT
ncbi:hypothetical protein DRO21_00860 [archaeon]|nr:MAG: hypothetical protein DRO21_00860 [archaeon]